MAGELFIRLTNLLRKLNASFTDLTGTYIISIFLSCLYIYIHMYTPAIGPVSLLPLLSYLLTYTYSEFYLDEKPQRLLKYKK